MRDFLIVLGEGVTFLSSLVLVVWAMIALGDREHPRWAIGLGIFYAAFMGALVSTLDVK